jgi:hypothetical protein
MEGQSNHRSGPYRSVSVQVSTHVFDLEFQLVLGSLVGTLHFRQQSIHYLNVRWVYTLKARCSRKCAVPLVLSVSALLPASIQTPTVDV